MAKLVAYYSRAGENYFGGRYCKVDVGNTEKVACIIAELTGADMFKIEQKIPYSDDYRTCVEQASQDWKKGARPELLRLPGNMDRYDEIYLGYPNYCGTMPMAVYAFLESFDWGGRKIYPFCTHEGSGLGRTEEEILSACPGAEVKKGLAVRGSEADNAEDAVKTWL